MMSHHDYMAYALTLAEKGRNTVSPNPMVGCVIVKGGRIIGEGYHQKAGTPHAEIHALKQAGRGAMDATLYVTLEPCCHTGRTPPCTEAIIQSKIKHIFIATQDPYPRINGRGIQLLNEAGIKIHLGLLQNEAQQLNEIFFHYAKTKRPFVIAKWAMSLDGKTVTHPKDDRTISSLRAHEKAHALRAKVDAILIGAATARQDNPILTTRYTASHLPPKQPIRIVATTSGKLPRSLNLFDHTLPAKTIVATTKQGALRLRRIMMKKDIEILVLPQHKSGHIKLKSLLGALGKREITSLLVEGGMTLHESFMEENLINQLHIFLSPTLIGKMKSKKKLPYWKIQPDEENVHIIAQHEETTHV